ncbi:MAG: ABC transporter substrate-binding protein, partial [Armatimonadota bacterium]|nr:ABC transporter substrate-binding protein [Armatimonadota bacterium]
MLLALMVAVAGCMPAGPAVVGERPAGEQPGRSVPTKSLTIAVAGEPTHFLFDFGSTGFGSVGTADLAQAVHRGLASYDDRGILHPVLATEVPSRERGTWIVRPDGTMQTTYRLRPHVTWHDGTPLTARAFALGWELVNDRELPISATGSVRGLLDHLEVRDDHTLVLEWGRTYPFAHALTLSAFPAVPPHLVEATYRAEPTRVPDLAYWTREFVGLGPYQLGAWEPGSHIVLRAYDGYFAGRARIDTIDVRFMPHQPTIVANLLAGTVDGVINRALEFEQAMLVKEEWERAGRRPLVINQPTHWRMIPFQ